MSRVRAHGLSIDPPEGWEVQIFRRAGDDSSTRRADVGGKGTSNPVLHASTRPLVAGRGDYGSGVVETLGVHDAFLALVEFDPDAGQTALFATSPVPRRLAARGFQAHTLQRVIAGQGGSQAFAQEADRAFCLYAVVGSLRNAPSVVERLNQALATLEISPR